MVVSGTYNPQKEMSIRRRIAAIFNKREDDFSSLKEYNDYLEEVEDMIQNLVEGIDVPLIEARIAEYQKENAEQIMINQARKAEELAAALAASKGLPGKNDNNGNPQGGIGVETGQYAPMVPGGQPRPIGVAPQAYSLDVTDMQGYPLDDEEMMRLRMERGIRAGGWSIELSKKRALEEAFASIWI